jgi:hypothetical protein
MGLRRLLYWIVGLPLAVATVAFAVANRQWIVVSLDPVSRDDPFAAIAMPLWALFFCGILVGLIAGWIAAWLGQRRWRKAAKQARIELFRSQGEQERLKREAGSRQAVPTVEPSP